MQNPSRCYICGIELVPIPSGHQGRLQDNHGTKDHVPPDGLFCDPKPSNLITVPCCHKHNRKHSGVDERFRMLASLEITRNEGGEKILSGKVFWATLKKLRQPHFVAKVAGSLRDGLVMTNAGPVPIAVFTVQAQEVFDCVADITRGLLTHFHPGFDYRGHHFMVLDFHSATLAKGNASQQLKIIRDMVTKTHADHRGNFDEFRFWRQVEPQNCRGVWLLVFYEAVAFTVFHTPVPIDAAVLETARV